MKANEADFGMDDLNPYDDAGLDDSHKTGLWPAPDMSDAVAAEKDVANSPAAESAAADTQAEENITSMDLQEDSPLESEALEKLFLARDKIKERFRNMIFRGRCLLNKGHDSYAEKIFQKAADEGYHEASFQIGLLRANRVLGEIETGGKPDIRNLEFSGVFDGKVMRRDLAEHFAMMVDAVFRYADDHMLIQTREVLEKAVSLGLIDTIGPDQIDKAYRVILKKHRDTSWDPLVTEDETDIRDVRDPQELQNILNLRNFQDIMVLLAEGRKADRYDMPRILGVLMAKLVNFMGTEAFNDFVKRFSRADEIGGNGRNPADPDSSSSIGK